MTFNDSNDSKRNICSKKTDYICFAITCIICASVVMIGFYMIRTHKKSESTKSENRTGLTDLTNRQPEFETIFIIENETLVNVTVRFSTF